MRKAIIWTNDDPVHQHMYVALWGDGLTHVHVQSRDLFFYSYLESILFVCSSLCEELAIGNVMGGLL